MRVLVVTNFRNILTDLRLGTISHFLLHSRHSDSPGAYGPQNKGQ